MSSTVGVQNLLVNVFRPTYIYNTTSPLYTVKLDLSNVNAYSGNSVSVLRVDVGDSANNVYVGNLAGNDPTLTTNGCSNVTAIGYAAGSNVSNVLNSTYLGFEAGKAAQSASAVIGIGANAGGNGTSNIFIGNATRATGTNNILIGHGIDLSASSYSLRMGTAGKTTIAGDLSRAWIGVGGTIVPISSNTSLDVSGDAYVLGNLGVNISPGTRTLDVNGNFRTRDSNGGISYSNGTTTITDSSSNSLTFGSANVLVQFDTNTKTFRYDGAAFDVSATSFKFESAPNMVTYTAGTLFDISGAALRVAPPTGSIMTYSNSLLKGPRYITEQGTSAIINTGASMPIVAGTVGSILVTARGTATPAARASANFFMWDTGGANYDSIGSAGTSASLSIFADSVYLSNTSGITQAFDYAVTFFPLY